MAYGNILADTVQGSTNNTAPVFKDGLGVEVGQLCKAWVNFNGTGTVAIRSSFNVSSITDGGVGVYTVNFTTAMPDINYSCSWTTGIDSTSAYYANSTGYYSTTSVIVYAGGVNSVRADPAYGCIAVFR